MEGQKKQKEGEHKRLNVLIAILAVTMVVAAFAFERLKIRNTVYIPTPEENAQFLKDFPPTTEQESIQKNEISVPYQITKDPTICIKYPEFCKDPLPFENIHFINEPTFSFSDSITYFSDEHGHPSYRYRQYGEDPLLSCRDIANRGLKEECLGIPLKEAEISPDSKVVVFAEENLPGSYSSYKLYLEFFKKNGEKLPIPTVEYMMDYPNLDLYYANNQNIIIHMNGAGTNPTFLYYDGLYWRGIEFRSNKYLESFYHSKRIIDYDIGLSSNGILRLKERWWPYNRLSNEKDNSRIYLGGKRSNTFNFVFDLKNDTEKPTAVYVRDFMYDDSSTDRFYSFKDAAETFPEIAKIYDSYFK